MAEVMSFYEKFIYISELTSDFEIHELQLVEVQQDLADEEQRLVALEKIMADFLIILQKTREAGPGIDPDLEDDYRKQITSSMAIVQPNNVHLEETGIEAFKYVNLTIRTVDDAIKQTHENRVFLNLSIEEEQRNLVEVREEILQKITELSNEITTYFDDIRIVLNRN